MLYLAYISLCMSLSNVFYLFLLEVSVAFQEVYLCYLKVLTWDAIDFYAR